MKYDSIMIVDDNEVDNFVTRRALEITELCEQVNIFPSGREALDFLYQHHATPSKLPDLIFLDLYMPVVDGFVFLFEFDELPENVKHHCKIVVLSSAMDKKSIHKIKKNELVKEYIPKPLTEAAIQKLKDIVPPSHMLRK